MGEDEGGPHGVIQRQLPGDGLGRACIEYSPRVDGISRYLRWPRNVVPVEDTPMGALRRRLMEARASRAANAIIIFGSNNKNVAYATLQSNSPNELTVDVVHPAELPTRDIDMPVFPIMEHVARVSYDRKGRMLSFVIVPFAPPSEIGSTLGEAVEQTRGLLGELIALKVAGKTLRPQLSSGILGLPPEMLIRMTSDITGMSPAPELVPNPGEQTREDKAEALTQQVLGLLYPNVNSDDGRREMVAQIFRELGLNELWETRMNSTILHNPTDIAHFGKIYRPKPMSEYDLINEVYKRLKRHLGNWARGHALHIYSLSGSGFEYVVGDPTKDLSLRENNGEYGQMVSALLVEKNGDLPRVGFGYRVEAAEDAKGRSKVFVGIYLDGKFAYRIAVPLQLDMNVISVALDRNKPADYPKLNKIIEYSTNPLHNINSF